MVTKEEIEMKKLEIKLEEKRKETAEIKHFHKIEELKIKIELGKLYGKNKSGERY